MRPQASHSVVQESSNVEKITNVSDVSTVPYGQYNKQASRTNRIEAVNQSPM